MRDYDDYDDDRIRLYTPVLQRVMILAGVIIAVPVVMWTITTFVRSYVARPKAPALEHVASTAATVPITAISAAPPSAAPVKQSAPLRADPAAARDAPNPPVEMKKAAPNPAALPDSPAPSVAANNQVAALQTEPAQTSSPAIATATTAAASDAATASLPRPSQAPRSTDNAAASSASTDRGIAWPNPNTDNPPDFTASRRPQPAAPPARVAAVETVPDSQPIRGPVPMPRHRPGIFALASAATTASTLVPSGASGGGPVPLPRIRPVGAPAEAAKIELPTGARPELESPH